METKHHEELASSYFIFYYIKIKITFPKVI